MRVYPYLALAALTAAGVWAQQQPTQYKQEVTIVATGKDGAPVQDLKVSDITIKDNNKKQEIISFEKVTPESEPGPGKPAVHNYVLLDELNTTYRDLPEVRAEMVRMMDAIAKSKNTTFLTLRGNLSVLHDPAKTESVVTKFAASGFKGLEGAKPDLAPYDWLFNSELGLLQLFSPAGIFDRQRVERSMDAMKTIAQNAGARAGRKNLFWISQGFPLVMGGPAGYGAAAMDTIGTGGSQTGAAMGSGVKSSITAEGSRANDLQAYAKDMDFTTRVVNNSNLAVYPIDSRFLAVDDAKVSDRSMMEDIAKATGGIAFTSRRDVGAALKEAFDDSKVVYVVRYAISDLKMDGKTHDIKVETNRKDVKMRYRGGYFAPEAKK